MKAIILAAGKGRRLENTGWDMPKCLLSFHGVTLLDNTLRTLVDNGVNEAAIVVGYKKEHIIKAVSEYPLKFTFFENQNYEDTNTINSLWLAAEFADEDVVYFNSDVLFEPRIVALLIAQPYSALAVHRKTCGQEEVKVILGENNRVLRIGKEFCPKSCAGEFVGIAVFRKEIWPDFKEALHYYNEVAAQKNKFFEVALDRVCDKHIICATDISKFAAIEIDTPEDLENARKAAKFLKPIH